MKKTSVEQSYLSVACFTRRVQLKGVRPWAAEAYAMMVRLLARWARRDPAGLTEEQARALPSG